jgi:hypothetical protein
LIVRYQFGASINHSEGEIIFSSGEGPTQQDGGAININASGMGNDHRAASVRPVLGGVNQRVEDRQFDGNPRSDHHAVIGKTVGCCNLTAMGLNNLARNAEPKTRMGAKCLAVRPSRVEALEYSVFMFVGETWPPIITDDLYRIFSST